MSSTGSLSTVAEVVARLQSSIAATDVHIRAVHAAMPSWLPNFDLRIQIFDNARKNPTVALLSLIAQEERLARSSDWHRFIPDFDVESHPGTIEALVQSIKHGLGLRSFIMVEHLFRNLLQASAGGRHPDERKAWLVVRQRVSTFLATPFTTEELALLDLMASVRNLIHHDGTYMPKTPGSRTIVWDGNAYQLDDGKKVGFVTWSFLIDMVDGLHALMARVVLDPNVARIPGPIHSPSYPPPTP